MALYTGRDIFIRVLNAQGVEDIFYNPGLDVVPFLSAAARFKARGQPAPRPVMCLDEFAALNAAHGHYLISGKPQVVLVHAELGTQQVGGAIQQAWYGKVPVIICAADMSRPGRLNWRAEPFDPGTMLRNCVKWDHRVSEKENFQAVLQEAFQRALSEPCGPVYLSYPLDIISRKAEMSPLTAASAGDWAAVDEGLLAQAAALLQNAVTR
jgi:acetolactate synthase-1/2/3 large subunit